MAENGRRRHARRQTRGLLRVEEILRAAGSLFAEVGYDKTTTNQIAMRAGITPGSLYQFFPHKEAIAQAYATQAVERLEHLYDSAILVPEVMALPASGFIDHLVDALVAFNQENPGYFALSQGATISPDLARFMQDLRPGLSRRVDRCVEVLAPRVSTGQRELFVQVTYSVFMALLPLILRAEESRRRALVDELKALLTRYFAPMR
jgi:AcrR family transcriptional regulator